MTLCRTARCRRRVDQATPAPCEELGFKRSPASRPWTLGHNTQQADTSSAGSTIPPTTPLRIVDPIQQRHLEGGSAEHESELGVPQSTEIGANVELTSAIATIDVSVAKARVHLS